MDTIDTTDELQQYNTAKTYVIRDAATESDARTSAVLTFRDDFEFGSRIKNLEAFVRPHPKGYEVAVVAQVMH